MPPDTGRAAGMDTNPGGEERRRFERHNIYLPVVASGKDRRGERVTESTFTVNRVPWGRAPHLPKRVHPGECVGHLLPAVDECGDDSPYPCSGGA